MKTPKEFISNLKKGVVTIDMLIAALYSVNKRAKNARDKQREYRKKLRGQYYLGYYAFDNEEAAEKRKEMYYGLKTELLGYASSWLSCIHILSHDREKRKRIYDYQKEYNSVKRKDVVWSNHYFDYETGLDVWFVDIVESRYKIYEYLLFYDFGSCSFHSPITEEEYLKMKGQIKEEELENLETEGKDINDLISVQFVHKILDALKSGKALVESKKDEPE